MAYQVGPRTAFAHRPCQQGGPKAGTGPVSRPRAPGIVLIRPRAVQVASSSGTSIPQLEVQAASPAGVTTFALNSGEELLRPSLLAQKVDLYTTWGKVTNCGGGGSCGTCIVEVLEGAELLSERTDAEVKKLKGKPASWRLACQVVCGDGANSGKLSVRTQPKA